MGLSDEHDGTLHFLADSNAAITKGIVALVLSAVQDKPAAEVAAMDVAAALEPFDLRNQLSSNRTQGVPNMIALVKQHAAAAGGGLTAARAARSYPLTTERQ